MALMYDTIMELPLFKGIGTDQLSTLLEKTKVEFLNYKESEIIAEATQQVKGVDFIIGGKVKNIYELSHYPIRIEETLGPGSMIGALRLYGLDTTYGATSVAEGNVSIMRIEKSQYMNILCSDRIYILNFVNYLSAASQKIQHLMQEQEDSTISRALETLAYSFASRRAEKVKVAGSDEALAQYCGVSLEKFLEWKTTQTTKII